MTGFGFPGRYKLNKTDEFSSVFVFRKRITGPGLVIHFKPNDCGHARLGLVVVRKTTRSAVRRNYMRRALREMFRQSQQELGSVDLVIRPQKTFGKQDVANIRQEFQQAVERLCRQAGCLN